MSEKVGIDMKKNKNLVRSNDCMSVLITTSSILGQNVEVNGIKSNELQRYDGVCCIRKM